MGIIEEIEKQIEQTKIATTRKNVGKIIEVGDGVVRVEGLSDVGSSELVSLPNNVTGLALNLEEDGVGVIIFGNWTKLKEGDACQTTGKILEVPVGEALVGRVVNALGRAPLVLKLTTLPKRLRRG